MSYPGFSMKYRSLSLYYAAHIDYHQTGTDFPDIQTVARRIWIITFAGVMALVIALLTFSWQSWQAARRNPVKEQPFLTLNLFIMSIISFIPFPFLIGIVYLAIIFGVFFLVFTWVNKFISLRQEQNDLLREIIKKMGPDRS